MAKLGSFVGKLAALGVDMSNSPSFTASTVFDQKSGLYLPAKKWDGAITIPTEALSNATTTTDFSKQGYWSPWRLGVSCMQIDLSKGGFWSMRLAEKMYLASRVFEHNLAMRAHQHGIRVR